MMTLNIISENNFVKNIDTLLKNIRVIPDHNALEIWNEIHKYKDMIFTFDKSKNNSNIYDKIGDYVKHILKLNFDLCEKYRSIILYIDNDTKIRYNGGSIHLYKNSFYILVNRKNVNEFCVQSSELVCWNREYMNYTRKIINKYNVDCLIPNFSYKSIRQNSIYNNNKTPTFNVSSDDIFLSFINIENTSCLDLLGDYKYMRGDKNKYDEKIYSILKTYYPQFEICTINTIIHT